MKRKFMWAASLCVIVLTGCAQQKKGDKIEITPVPLSCMRSEGDFHWSTQTKVAADFQQIDKQLVETALQGTGLPLNFSDQKEKGMVILELDSTLNSAEGYVLKVSPKQISLKALNQSGIFYGLQTLKQLTDTLSSTVQGVEVIDEPRFPYRGIMLDVSRHFRTVDFIKKQMDLMAFYKMNYLHLHLTDAAGWRIEIKKYPRLTELAAWRKQEVWKEWWNGKREYCDSDFPGAYGGYYTKEDIAELLRYAAMRQITVIPEIEMPSHSEEVFAAYPELSCSHKPGASDFCVGNEKTFRFLEDVLTEVIEMFPSEYIHIGGDEAGKGAWKTCALCQKRIKDEKLANVDELQSYLIHRIEVFLNSKGRKLLGWDEILEGGLAPNATVMSWRGESGGIKAVRAGHHAIMTPGEFCYLDGYQDAPYSQPEAIGGYLPLKKVYHYEPVPDTLRADEKKLILGVQGNLWTEYIPTDEHMEYMLYPRAIALAETGWSIPENKSWNSFHARILKETDRLIHAGYHPFNIREEIGNRPQAAEPAEHLAVGKTVIFNHPFWKSYPAHEEQTLTDGVCGGWNYNDKRWLGFTGKDNMDVVVDLEQETKVSSISATFMQICGPWVYFPARVIISSSNDGKEYTTLTTINHKVVKDDAVSFKDFAWQGETTARYIRYQAFPDSVNAGVQFVDEIIIK